MVFKLCSRFNSCQNIKRGQSQIHFWLICSPTLPGCPPILPVLHQVPLQADPPATDLGGVHQHLPGQDSYRKGLASWDLQTKPGSLRHLTLPREVPKRTAPTALRNQRKHCMVSMLLSSVVRHNSVLGSSISYQITHICPCWDCMRRTTAWHHSIPSVSSWVFHSEC